jgi:putative transposase
MSERRGCAALRFHRSSQRYRPSRGAIATRPDEQRSMDFVSGALFDGRRIRALTLVGNRTREALAIVVDSGIRGEQVTEAVERVAAPRGAPCLIGPVPDRGG